MHRNDDSNYFLYIEPSIKEKSKYPKNDIYSESVQYFLNRAKTGISTRYDDLECLDGDFYEDDGYRGVHTNCDGEYSSNQDYLLENGFITNSLCVHYVRWFRKSITGKNLQKLEILKELYETKK